MGVGAGLYMYDVVVRPHRSTTYTPVRTPMDAAYCYQPIAWSVGLSVTVAVQKTAELIEMPFGLWIRVGRRKHVLHGGTLAPPGEYD